MSDEEKSSQKGRKTGADAFVRENMLAWELVLVVAIGYSTSCELAESEIVKSQKITMNLLTSLCIRVSFSLAP